MTEHIQCVVIGAGVVGLACARALADQGMDLVILEAEDAIGTQTSARNSEVIHAGIYYKTGSQKARLCKPGRDMLYDYCANYGIEHKKIGKLIVATNDTQIEKLDEILQKGLANGVTDLTLVTKHDVAQLEAEVECVAALWSPSTGIVDSHSLMLSFLGDAEKKGAFLSIKSPVEGGRIENKGFSLDIGGSSPMKIKCDYVVNAAGFSAQTIAQRIDGIPPDTIPEQHLARGSYFILSGKSPFRHLVYPVPSSSGLGVHVTIDLSGRAKFGPDVEWIDKVDYTVNLSSREKFYREIKKYWPSISKALLQPGYAGIRPRTYPSDGPPTDFIIQGHEIHNIKGMVNLYGIESPGLTSSLAIADKVVSLLN